LPVSVALAFLSLATPGIGSALERFFIGTTQGSGSVNVIMSGRHGMRDRTRGRMDAGGALLLDQIVEEDGKPARRRTWRLVHSGGNRITGTISDARGPVAGEITETALHLRYRLEEGPVVEQWVVLQPGGRSAKNRMTFHRFGLKVATVESEIRKVE